MESLRAELDAARSSNEEITRKLEADLKDTQEKLEQVEAGKSVAEKEIESRKEEIRRLRLDLEVAHHEAENERGIVEQCRGNEGKRKRWCDVSDQTEDSPAGLLSGSAPVDTLAAAPATEAPTNASAATAATAAAAPPAQPAAAAAPASNVTESAATAADASAGGAVGTTRERRERGGSRARGAHAGAAAEPAAEEAPTNVAAATAAAIEPPTAVPGIGRKAGHNSHRNYHGSPRYYWRRVEGFNSKGYPLRGGVANCDFYMRTWSCRFGEECIYNQPE